MRGGMRDGGKGRARRGDIRLPLVGRAQRRPHHWRCVPRALVPLTAYSPCYKSHLGVRSV